MAPGPLRRFLASSVGSKVVVGLTGLLLSGFLVAHLAGNLLLVAGPGAFNAYAHALSSNPLLVPAEIALLALAVVHAGKAVALTLANRAARPERYRLRRPAGPPSHKSVASTWMIASGGFLVCFVIAHLLHFKWGVHHSVEGGPQRDLFRTVAEFYSSPAQVGFYVAAMAILFLHLRHGVWSAFQSLGAGSPRLGRFLLRAGVAAAAVIALGFAFLPLYMHLVHGGRP